MLASDIRDLPERVVSKLDGSMNCPRGHALVLGNTHLFKRRGGMYDYRCGDCLLKPPSPRAVADPLAHSVYTQRSREKRRRNGDDRRYRLKKYGLTEASFDAMLAAQGNRCPICEIQISEATKEGPRYFGLPGMKRIQTATTINIDHAHDTNKVRGLLCMLCNRGLGDFKDSAAALRRAADYIEATR